MFHIGEPSPTHHPLSHKGRGVGGPTAQISLSNVECRSNAIFVAPTSTDYFEHDEESVCVDDEATNRPVDVQMQPDAYTDDEATNRPVDVHMQPNTYTGPGMLSWPWSTVWLEEKIMAKIDPQSPNLPANKIVKNKLGVCKNDDGYNLHDGTFVSIFYHLYIYIIYMLADRSNYQL